MGRKSGLLIFGFFWCFWLHAQHKIPQVLSTTTIIHDMVRTIGDSLIQPICLMPVGGDPHTYEPTPADAKKVVSADLIFKNGLYLEGWLDELLLNAGTKAPIVTVSDGIKPIQSNHLHGSPDPHVWMNPLYGIVFVENITRTLVSQFPKHKETFEKNAKIYIQSIRKVDQSIQNSIQKLKLSDRVLITSHDAFKYYGRQYGVRVESVLGTSTDAEVQIADVQRLIQIIQMTGIKAIFIESTINPKLMQQLAQDHGVRIGGKLFADSVGDTISGANTYLSMLESNTNVFVHSMLAVQNPETKAQNEVLWLLIVSSMVFLLAFVLLYVFIHQKVRGSREFKELTVEVKNLTVSYQKKTVITGIGFELKPGKLYGLLGPNGAGKSTLFKSIMGLIQADAGEILIGGKSISEVRKYIAYIPQKEEIDWGFPATVFDVVLTGRIPHMGRFSKFSAKDKLKALEAIHKMGMDEFLDRQIGDLSGGQQQRVFIARALCQEAEVLMFDEPFVGVDVTTEEKIIQIIKALAQAQKTILIIHHDLSKVKDYFDGVIMINQRLIAFGDTKEVFTQENIAKTYGGRLAILQEADKYVF